MIRAKCKECGSEQAQSHISAIWKKLRLELESSKIVVNHKHGDEQDDHSNVNAGLGVACCCREPPANFFEHECKRYLSMTLQVILHIAQIEDQKSDICMSILMFFIQTFESKAYVCLKSCNAAALDTT